MHRTDRFTGIILLFIATWVLYMDWQLPVPVTTDAVGPKVYPGLLSIILASLSIILIVTGSSQYDRNITSLGLSRRFIPLVGFAAAYTVLLPLLGFVLATMFLLFASFYLVGERNLWLNLIVALGATAFIYLLFTGLLGIAIPLTPWILKL